MQKQRLIRHVDFSEVSVMEIVAPGSDFIVTTMQNQYNPKGISFIP